MNIVLALLLTLLVSYTVANTPSATPISGASGVPCVIFTNADVRYLKVEFLAVNLAHFEVSENRASLPCSTRVYSTQMVNRRDYTYSTSMAHLTTSSTFWSFFTSNVLVQVDKSTLNAIIYDTSSGGNFTMTQVSWANLSGVDLKTMQLGSYNTAHVYGIGEQFKNPHGSSEGDWKTYPDPTFIIPGDHCGNKVGNAVQGWDCRGSGVAQFPMGYFVKQDTTKAYGLFFDNQYYHDWNFGSDPMTVTSYGDHLRFFVIQGPALSTIRQTYMDLVGRPTVPNKQVFGLSVGKFGYTNFDGMFNDLNALKQANFPLDGLALDLFWFGGSFYPEGGDGRSLMGSITWDTDYFNDPASNLAALNAKGVGITLITEPYVSWGLAEYQALANNQQYLANLNGYPSYIDYNPWWGKGGMIDFTNPAARQFWFDNKYCQLLDTCNAPCTICSGPKSQVHTWWSDLAEPEMYNCGQTYKGWTEDSSKWYYDEGSVHNLYAFFWAMGLYEGYVRNNVSQRLFQLIRSGAPGIQRFGAGMWSGDICGTLESLSDHYDVQKHMSMVGIDYFASDTAGYAIGDNAPDRYQTFTQWFANEAWFAIPFRTHGDQFDQDMETNPAQVGDVLSNKYNTRQRYELVPYYYSLAHMAHLFGSPIVPPVFYNFQADPNTHGLGNIKMIGQYLLVAISTVTTQTQRDVYLPSGLWYNYHTNQPSLMQQGGYVYGVSQFVNDKFDPTNTGLVLSLAAFAIAGAIIPKTFVNNNTENVLGLTPTGTFLDPNAMLYVRSYVDYTKNSNSNFNLYEDDGSTNEYLQYTSTNRGLRVTNLQLAYATSTKTITFTVASASGTYSGAVTQRPTTLEIVIDTARSGCNTWSSVTVQAGTSSATSLSQVSFSRVLQSNGWAKSTQESNLFVVNLLSTNVNQKTQFTMQCHS